MTELTNCKSLSYIRIIFLICLGACMFISNGYCTYYIMKRLMNQNMTTNYRYITHKNDHTINHIARARRITIRNTTRWINREGRRRCFLC